MNRSMITHLLSNSSQTLTNIINLVQILKFTFCVQTIIKLCQTIHSSAIMISRYAQYLPFIVHNRSDTQTDTYIDTHRQAHTDLFSTFLHIIPHCIWPKNTPPPLYTMCSDWDGVSELGYNDKHKLTWEIHTAGMPNHVYFTTWTFVA